MDKLEAWGCLNPDCTSDYLQYGTADRCCRFCGKELACQPRCACGTVVGVKSVSARLKRREAPLHCAGCGKAWTEEAIAHLLAEDLSAQLEQIKTLLSAGSAYDRN